VKRFVVLSLGGVLVGEREEGAGAYKLSWAVARPVIVRRVRKVARIVESGM